MLFVRLQKLPPGASAHSYFVATSESSKNPMSGSLWIVARRAWMNGNAGRARSSERGSEAAREIAENPAAASFSSSRGCLPISRCSERRDELGQGHGQVDRGRHVAYQLGTHRRIDRPEHEGSLDAVVVQTRSAPSTATRAE